MFPDAPTERGARHLFELVKALKDGYRAAVLFIIQRDDAYKFTANDETIQNLGRLSEKPMGMG